MSEREYTVLVRRVTCQSEEITVKASSPGDAETSALEKAYRIDWDERNFESEYETEIVSR